MKFETDIEISQKCEKKNICEIAEKAGIADKYIEPYGKFKAKIDNAIMNEISVNKNGKLILVSAITPTPAGEGKTTTSIGIADALNRLGKKVLLCLREPSLGPVFGIKGGATGGGHAQVVPMEDINLHFTGDFHAIGAANNLLAAMLDNHILKGNELGIDPERIVLKRAVDMNDRQLRYIEDGLGGEKNGYPRKDGFEITVATETMAVFCMAKDITDLKARLGKMIVAYTYDGKAVTAHDLKAEGAMTVLLKDAVKPNIVQTLEGTPAIIHGGPFANIAHGCNSVIATQMAVKLSDYVVTEAGFAADLGAEKFLDIKCRTSGINPSAVAIVATIRALKYHGGVEKTELEKPNCDAVKKGIPNLERHVKNITDVYGLPCLVVINAFPTDTDEEIDVVKDCCNQMGVKAELSRAWEKGGEGAVTAAKQLIQMCEEENKFAPCYELEAPIDEKIGAVCTKIYHADNVIYTDEARKQIKEIEKLGLSDMPVCIAKTQYSFSDDPKKLGAPSGFGVTVKNIKADAGAGFIVVYTGDIMTMPGLPKKPAAEDIDIDENGVIKGLF